jgi:hypothetical protein
MKMSCRWAFLLGALVLAAHSQPVRSELGAIGAAWAGDRARLVVDERGGRLELDCASGRISSVGPLVDGSAFSAAGTFERHAAGVQVTEAATATRPAQYVGEVKDGALTLSIQVEGEARPQVLHLRQGATVKLVRCL